MRVAVDRFTFFSGFVELVAEVGDLDWPVLKAQLWVGDVLAAKGAVTRGGAGARIHIRALTDFTAQTFKDVSLKLIGPWGRSASAPDLGYHQIFGAGGHRLFQDFLRFAAEKPDGAVLEIGSRARSGITRRSLLAENCRYTGLDIVAGENVDVVGDAHEMSSLLPAGRFRGVFSLSVLEHIAMPWKLAVELAKVMEPGGLAFFMTHQTYPAHDQPWDFWRFSKDAWPALFNRRTGFEIVEAEVAEPSFVISQRWQPGANHGDALGWACSSVLVRKVGEPMVDWPVPLHDLVTQHYPG